MHMIQEAVPGNIPGQDAPGNHISFCSIKRLLPAAWLLCQLFKPAMALPTGSSYDIARKPLTKLAASAVTSSPPSPGHLLTWPVQPGHWGAWSTVCFRPRVGTAVYLTDVSSGFGFELRQLLWAGLVDRCAADQGSFWRGGERAVVAVPMHDTQRRRWPRERGP